jgi:small subunit ribosomal protein S18
MQPKRFQRRKFCRFCADKVSFIDYKDIKILRGYMTERGKLLSRKVTGNCSVHQRELTTAVKRARNIALIPFMER